MKCFDGITSCCLEVDAEEVFLNPAACSVIRLCGVTDFELRTERNIFLSVSLSPSLSLSLSLPPSSGYMYICIYV